MIPSIAARLELRHGASFAEVAFDSRDTRAALRPHGEMGRASWGLHAGLRWLGFRVLMQRFDR